MSLRFLLDEDISYRVAEGLRRRSIDAVSVHEIGRANQEISDEGQLAFAGTKGCSATFAARRSAISCVPWRQPRTSTIYFTVSA